MISVPPASCGLQASPPAWRLSWVHRTHLRAACKTPRLCGARFHSDGARIVRVEHVARKARSIGMEACTTPLWVWSEVLQAAPAYLFRGSAGASPFIPRSFPDLVLVHGSVGSSTPKGKAMSTACRHKKTKDWKRTSAFQPLEIYGESAGD